MASEKPASKVRRVKNPETFREKAIKASETDVKKSKIALISGLIIKILIKPIVKIFAALSKTKIARIIWKVIKKPLHIIGLVLLPRYIRNSWQELKLVTWPNWKTSRKLTSAVIVFALIFGITVAIVDFLLDKLFRNVLLK